MTDEFSLILDIKYYKTSPLLIMQTLYFVGTT